MAAVVLGFVLQPSSSQEQVQVQVQAAGLNLCNYIPPELSLAEAVARIRVLEEPM